MKKLTWDSNFWGIDIFQVEKQNIMESIEEHIKISSTPFLIQSLVNVADLQSIGKLEEIGFKFKESKITMVMNVLEINKNLNADYKKIETDDLEFNRDSIDNLFLKNTRFDIFNEIRVNEFYYTWLKNSVTGEMDDTVIGYYIKEKLAGFITYSIDETKVSVGLLGVLSDFQGKGVSRHLLNYVENVALENSLQSIFISTQGKNLKALNAYIKNNYRIHSIEHWYYYQKGALK